VELRHLPTGAGMRSGRLKPELFRVNSTAREAVAVCAGVAGLVVDRAALQRWIPVTLAALISVAIGVLAYTGHALEVTPEICR
jgi:hypothetical protein